MVHSLNFTVPLSEGEIPPQVDSLIVFLNHSGLLWLLSFSV